jgi:hypothetical protein
MSWASRGFKCEVALIGMLSLAIGSNYLSGVWLLEEWEGWKLLLLFSTGALALMTRGKVMPFPRRTAMPVVLWVLFALATLISTVFHGRGYSSAVWYLLGIPLLVFNMLPMLLGRRGNFIAACSLVVVSICFIIWSLAVAPIHLGRQPYTGVFTGTPTMATVCALMIIGSLGLLSGIVSRKIVSSTPVIILSVLLLVGFVMVFSTAYRTAIATSLITLAVFTVANYRKSVHLMRVYAAFGGVMLLVVVVAWLSGVGEQVRFWEAAMQKQQEKASGGRAGGIWSYRQTEWLYIISHANLIGHGVEAGEDQPVLMSFHSPFTTVLGSYGIPAVLFFTSFWFVSLLHAYRYTRRAATTDPHNLFPLLCIVFFFFHSLGAVLLTTFASGAIFAFFIAIGTVIMHDAVRHRESAKPS